MKLSRWLVFVPAATLAIFGGTAKAVPEYVTWTCWASSDSSWTMFQPTEHYSRGYYPSWSDCEAWRNGTPDDGYVWSYGLTATTTTQTTSTTSTTVELTTTTSTSSSVPTTEETWVTTTESTTTVPTNTTGVPSSTVPAETTTSSSMVTTTVTTAAPWVPPPTYETTTTTIVETTTTTVESSTLPSTTTSTVVVTTVPKPSSTTSTTEPTIPPETSTTLASPTTIPVPQPITPLRALTFAQAEQVFAELDTDEMSESEIQAIVDAVQYAPTEVREAFEESVDVFGDGFDDYVPLGSTVPVETRRTLIAVAAGTGLAAVGASRRNN